MSKRARPQDFPAGEEGRFGCLWAAGKAAVAKVFAGDDEADGLVDFVWERARGGFARALEMEREDEAHGEAFKWTAWLVKIAVNLRIDLGRREETFRKKAGTSVWLDAPRAEIWTDSGSETHEGISAHETVADRWGCSPDEEAAWNELRELVRRLVRALPLPERYVVVAWVKERRVARVARRLKIPEMTARGRLERAFDKMRLELTALGYDAETRPREQERDRYGFITTRKGKTKTARASGAETDTEVSQEDQREAA